MKIEEKIRVQLIEHVKLVDFILNNEVDRIMELSQIVFDCLRSGNKLILFGNGGSAADAQHLAAEFTGRFVKERKGLAAIALTTDTSALTAIGNDYGFHRIFERQIEAIANSGDVLIGISTSGNSINVINGIELGNKLGCRTISFTGKDGGELIKLAELNININSSSTARIQELHIIIGHLLCYFIDEKFS